MVRSLLNYGMDVDCQQDDLRTPLHLAASQGELRVARELLGHKESADPLGNRGNTPPHLLFEDNDRDVSDLARLSPEHGAEVNRRDQDNDTLRRLERYSLSTFPNLPNVVPPTCSNIRVRTARDAEIIFHAVRLGILPMVVQRLGSEERKALCSGCVYVWEERSGSLSESMEQGIEHFTEGRSWGPSR